MAKRRSVGKGDSMATLAKAFGAAEARFKKAAAEYRAAGEALESLRATMLRHVGAAASKFGKSSGSRGNASGGNAPRAGSLGSFVLTVMKDGHERGPAEVYGAVMKAGFKSKGTEKSRMVMVTQTMAKLTKRGLLAKKGHGVYTAA